MPARGLLLNGLRANVEVSNKELAQYIEYLKEENEILRARIPGQIHTKPSERERLIKFGKALGRAIEELITIVSPSTFYRWLRDGEGKVVKDHKGGQRKPREIREVVILIAKTTRFGVRGDSILLRPCAALYFVTFDTGGDAMDNGALDEAAAGAFFMNFVSGI